MEGFCKEEIAHWEENAVLRAVGDSTSLEFKSRLVMFLLHSGRPMDDGDGTHDSSRTVLFPCLAGLISHLTSPSVE